MSKQQQTLDNFFAQLVGETGHGIDGLLDAFFGFLGRRTDFYHQDVERARTVVLDAFERHRGPSLERRAAESAKKAAESAKKTAAAATTAVPAKSPKMIHPQVEDITEEGEEEEVGSNAPEGNGGRTEKYRWTQTLNQAEIFIRTAKPTRGRDCKVEIQPKRLTVKIHGEVVVEGELSSMCLPEDSIWTVEDEGAVLHITLEKLPTTTPEWWSCIIKGDPEIDTQKIVPEPSKLSDLDPELRSTVEKMMFDQEMKQRGMPTSDQQKHARMLEQFQKQHPELDFSKAKISYPQ